jgi:hypothetical protein
MTLESIVRKILDLYQNNNNPINAKNIASPLGETIPIICKMSGTKCNPEKIYKMIVAILLFFFRCLYQIRPTMNQMYGTKNAAGKNKILPDINHA